VRTIAVLNQKGGVGKTTTVANIGSALAQRGQRVCLVDLDPQAHLTLHFGLEPGDGDAGIYDVLTDSTPISDALVDVRENLRVCPAVIDLAAAEVELASTVGREQILRDAMDTENLQADTLMIDCPPSLGLLTLNALAAVDEVFIPLQPHFLALQGLGKLLETVSLVHKRINPRLRVTGVILCMYESTTRLAGEVLQDLQDFFTASRGQDRPWAGARIFDTVIRRNIKLAECPSHGQTIFEYEPASNGAADYNALADEILSMLVEDAQDAGPDSQEDQGAETSPTDAAQSTAEALETSASDETFPAPQTEYAPEATTPTIPPIVESGPADDVAEGDLQEEGHSSVVPRETPEQQAAADLPSSTEAPHRATDLDIRRD
jgi:chromosome partitioning protein